MARSGIQVRCERTPAGNTTAQAARDMPGERSLLDCWILQRDKASSAHENPLSGGAGAVHGPID